ncbi:MAG TPA: XrtA/PEP-CTERM system-associated ATPase [Burkholderiaceae bacterium]|nr:XrtA/PEP-CTERM system-associated ATPase [Burkholderiaceae bacterium]
MYESHFGLSGAPFQLNPDPAFYFDSRGHSNALAYLRFGVYQGEGFIVVTGEIGAGKTTLVRALLEGLDADRIVAAQVVSTQLESGDLLRSIVTAFGIPAQGTTKSQLLATLESFLTALAAKKRRALLVIDEAQNLGREAIEELRMLSNFQLGNHALLQSFLVGQPELRKLIESPSMEQLRQRIIASCHLGPLDNKETRAYVEHRLHHVGWKDSPRFDAAAFDAIHQWTDGIPRRINLLCNRLLLSAFLGNQPALTAELVDRTGRELRGETGESSIAAPMVSPVTTAAPAAAAAAGMAAAARGGPRPAELGHTTRLRIVDEGIIRQAAGKPPARGGGYLLCVVGNRQDALRCAALAQALAAVPQLPALVFVNPGSQAALAQDSDVAALLPPPGETVHLGVAEGSPADCSAAVTLRFDSVLDDFKPAAVLAMGQSDAVLACCLLTRRRGVPLLRLGGGMRHTERLGDELLAARLIDAMADWVYTHRLTAHYALYREGVAAQSVLCIGDPLLAVMRALAPIVPAGSDVLGRLGVPRPWRKHASHGYALVSCQVAPGDLEARDLRDFAAVLRALGRDTPLLWPLTERTLRELQTQGLERVLGESHIALAPPVSHVQHLALMRDAACLLSGPGATHVDEACSLRLRTLMLSRRASAPTRVDDLLLTVMGFAAETAVRELNDIVQSAGSPKPTPAQWDAEAGVRLADHLQSWLADHSRRRRRVDQAEVAA